MATMNAYILLTTACRPTTKEVEKYCCVYMATFVTWTRQRYAVYCML